MNLKLIEDTGVNAYDAGDYVLASRIFKKLLKQAPSNITCHFYLALIGLHTGKLADALKYGKTVVRLSPKELNAYVNLGCIYEKMGNLRLAIRCFKKELSQNPGCLGALTGLGLIYFDRHKYKIAADYLEPAFNANPQHFDVRNQLSIALLKTKQLRREIRLYRGCLERDIKDVWSLQNLGAALIDAGEFRRALLFLKKAKRFSPDDSSIDRNIQRALKGSDLLRK